jgi:hypothetical protein
MNMPLSEQAKLAAEYESSANNAVTDWATVPELVDFEYALDTHSDTVGKSVKVLHFDDLVAEYSRLKEEIEFRKEKQDELKAALEAAVLMGGKEKVSCGGYRLAIISKVGSKKIMPEKLIAQGVSVETIVNATVVSAGSQYLDCRRIKDKD